MCTLYSKLWAMLTYHNNILEQCTLRVCSVKMVKNVGLYSRGTGLWQCQGECTLPKCGQGSVPAQFHMWVEFVVGSRLALWVFH